MAAFMGLGGMVGPGTNESGGGEGCIPVAGGGQQCGDIVVEPERPPQEAPQCLALAAGNFLVAGSEVLADGSLVLYVGGAGALFAGAASAQPGALAPGLAALRAGGFLAMGSSISLTAGGVLQGIGGGGWDNAANGAGALALGSAVGWLGRPFGARRMLSVRERGIQHFADNALAVNGAALDIYFAAFPNAGQQACPNVAVGSP